MKLRILGNSIRLRVSKSELTELADTGGVADAIEFSPGVRLCYRLRSAADSVTGANFLGGEIAVTVPAAALQELVETERVAIRGEQPLGNGESLAILIEKDFECLVPRPGEDPRDLFDNPARD